MLLELPHFAFEVVLTAIVATLLIMIPTLLLYKIFVEPRFTRRERSGAVCCGCACLDLFLLNAEVLPTRESLALVENTSFTPGCATSNTGRALAEMGTNVELLTLIGNDINGDTIMKIWQSQGIGVQFVRRTSDAPTSVANGKRGIYFCRGANLISDARILFGEKWEHLYIPKSALLFHFGYPGLLPKMQGDALAEIFARVKSTGAVISLDTTSLLDQEKHKKLVCPALPLTGIFHVNLEEAASLAGKIHTLLDRAKQVSTLTSAEDVITLEEVREIAETILAFGSGMVLVSLGCNGAYAATADADTITDRWGDLAKLLDVRAYANARLYVPAFGATPGATINATGAGDAFIGGVLAGFNLAAARQGGLARVLRVGHAAALQRVEIGRPALTAPQVLAAMDAGKLAEMVPPNPHLRAALAAGIAVNAIAPASAATPSAAVRAPRGRSPRRSKAH